MAETEASDDKAVHQSLLQRFKDEPKWVKIGALAGVAVLGITALLYFKNQGGQSNQPSSPATTDNSGISNGMGTSTDHPGEGDFHPPLPPGTGTPAGTPTGTPTGTTTTGSPGATSSPGSTPTSNPTSSPIRVPGPGPVAKPKQPVYSKSGSVYTSRNPADLKVMKQKILKSQAQSPFQSGFLKR